MDPQEQNNSDEDYEDVQEINQQQAIQIQQQDGCVHYYRNCMVEAPCCRIYYFCKLCHDDKYMGPKSQGCKTQRMEFDKVQNIKCTKCQKIQAPSQKCINPQCEVKFGQFACLKCMLYENNPAKVNDIFHCDDCRMCRRGKKQNFFHCDNCGYCRPISEKNKHKCTENIALSKCPICLEVLKFSTKHYIALKCGHLIHLQCLEGYTSINCPICGMALQKVSKTQNDRIEQMIAATKDNLPEQLKNKKVNIMCNQCLHKTIDAPFHFWGIKCEACGTFNTKMI